jgi:starch-binding outer membrane protein, SusD/RagB family
MTTYNKLRAIVQATIAFGSIGLTSCTKLIAVEPPSTSITAVTVYSSDATAADVLTGIYTNLSAGSPSNGGLTSMTFFPGLSADELTLYGNSNPTFSAYYQNALTSSNTGSSDFWNNIYPLIFTVNSAIEGVGSSGSLTPAVRQQLLGEGYFMRAFCYFYLVNLYGDVPLITGTDYSTNATFARTDKTQVWQQIVADLKLAQGFLSNNYLDGTILGQTQERLRPTSWAADALLSRAYLYQQKWDSAVSEASTVINNTGLYSLDSLNGVFLANSNEAIWQLQPVNPGQNTQDAILYILPTSGPDGITYPVYLDTLLVQAFEAGDFRRTNWIDSVIVGSTTYFYPYKYKVNVNGQPVTEYEMVLRLGEQYLIRAEAEAQLKDLPEALNDLNAIRTRAGLPADPAFQSQGDLLTSIYHERQVELFTEWGHRWLDLKRTATVDSVMSVVTPDKGGSWIDFDQWYPVPLYDIQHDPALLQTVGY